MSDITNDVQLLWDYMQLHQPVRRSDALFILCNVDLRVAERAAELYHQGFADWILVSGGSGELTKDRFAEPEAHVFARVLKDAGVPDDKIVIEDQSKNTGENVRFMAKTLKKTNLTFSSMTLVVDPYSERRALATFEKQWTGFSVSVRVTSPQIPFTEYCTTTLPSSLIIPILVGDVQRVMEYPALGFQTEQPVPLEVTAAYERLVAAGYTSRLIAAR